MRVLVLGGNPAGMSAAARIKRKAPDTEVVVLEKTQEVSYGACGLPYYVAGLNDDLDLIRIRKVSEFEKSGVNVHLGTEATGIDFNNKIVKANNNGNELEFNYDKLLIATGSSPKVPPIKGIDSKNIFCLKTLEDAENIKRELSLGDKKVVIVGGGYIGIEIAEACVLQKAKSITLVEAQDRVLNVFDDEFSNAFKEELIRNNVDVKTGELVKEFINDNDKVSGVITDKNQYEADLVILAIGVTPNTSFIEGIDKLKNGAIIVNEKMETSIPDVYAAGDCATVYHQILKKPAYIALGTNANKQGRVAGDVIMGKNAKFDRALGTSMLRFMNLEAGKTGIGENEAKENGFDYKVVSIENRSHARYYPDAVMINVKLIYDANTKVILGAEVMGPKEAAWRIDVLAVAIDQKMTTEELGYVDLGYAPMFAPVWDAIHIAANAAK